MSYIVRVDGREFRVDITREGSHFKISLNNKDMTAEMASPYSNSQIALIVDNKLYSVVFNAENKIAVNAEEYVAEIFDEHVHTLFKTSTQVGLKHEVVITVPMPGLIIDVGVKEGEAVKAGQGLIVVEAMKMQNEIKAPRDGIVKTIFIKKGQTVNSREKLIIIE